MGKNFDVWNSKKKILNEALFTAYIHEREIWWGSLGLNVGDEQDGKNESFERPVLVVKKFNRNVVLVVPLTTQIKVNKYYFSSTHETKPFAIILSQIRLISTKRLSRKIRKMDDITFLLVKKKLVEIILN